MAAAATKAAAAQWHAAAVGAMAAVQTIEPAWSGQGLAVTTVAIVGQHRCVQQRHRQRLISFLYRSRSVTQAGEHSLSQMTARVCGRRSRGVQDGSRGEMAHLSPTTQMPNIIIIRLKGQQKMGDGDKREPVKTCAGR